jgi:carboxypeptidase C (cathepsin A)
MAAMTFTMCGLQFVADRAGAAEGAPAPAEATARDQSAQTRHVISIDGTQLAYTATAGTLRLRLDKSDAEAFMFYVGYRKDGEEVATRPITFVFNGGPGSSAAWLHVGALGPRRLSLGDQGTIPEPPARLVDNAETWLRFTDLVFVDPVGTGFSRAIGKGEASAGQDAVRSGASRAIFARLPSSSGST